MTELGIPTGVERFPGIDRLGAACRIAPDVSVMRYAETPPGRTGISLGDDVSLYQGVRLVIGDPAQHPDTRLVMGDRIIVNVYAYLSGEGGLEIEDEVLIGSHAHILSAGHRIDGGHPSIWRNPLSHGRIRIGRGAWVGASALVLPGVTLGEGSVVGGGAVVTRDVPPFAVAIGNPARVHRYRHGFAPRRSWLARLLNRHE